MHLDLDRTIAEAILRLLNKHASESKAALAEARQRNNVRTSTLESRKLDLLIAEKLRNDFHQAVCESIVMK